MTQIDFKDSAGKTIQSIEPLNSDRFYRGEDDESDVSPLNLVIKFTDGTFSFIHPYSEDGVEFSPQMATKGYLTETEKMTFGAVNV
jgi:hypothetical protein